MKRRRPLQQVVLLDDASALAVASDGTLWLLAAQGEPADWTRPLWTNIEGPPMLLEGQGPMPQVKPGVVVGRKRDLRTLPPEAVLGGEDEE